MFADKRRKEIEIILKENGYVSVTDLSKKLSVSEATVRRDLTEMNALGVIDRCHGGALLHENATETSIFARINENTKEKEIIAYNAIKVLPEFSSLFIDSSSTALSLAERLDLSRKTVVTNNIQTALVLSKKQEINLILLGGSVAYNTNSSTGSYTVRQIEEFSFDLMICSCTSLKHLGAFERSLEQKEIKYTALKNSDKKFLLVDNTKFSSKGIYKFAGLTDFDYIVTDRKPSNEFLNKNIKIIY